MSDHQVHQNIRAWRHHRQLTVDQVANLSNAEIRTVEGWETGKIAIRTDVLEHLARVFKTDPGALFSPPPSGNHETSYVSSGLVSLRKEALSGLMISLLYSKEGLQSILRKADSIAQSMAADLFDQSAIYTVLSQNKADDIIHWAFDQAKSYFWKCPADEIIQNARSIKTFVLQGQIPADQSSLPDCPSPASAGPAALRYPARPEQDETLSRPSPSSNHHSPLESPLAVVEDTSMEKTGVPDNGTPVTGQEPIL